MAKDYLLDSLKLYSGKMFKETRTLVEDLLLSLHVARKILWWDTYQESLFLRGDLKVDHSQVDPGEIKQLRRILIESVNQIDLNSLLKVNPSHFRKFLKKITKELSPIDIFVKEYTLHFISNAHIDLGWLWRFGETIEVSRGTFQSVLKLMKKMPALRYTQSQAQIYQWVEEKYPSLFARIRAEVKAGRWEVIGGMWAEPDCNLIDVESFTRQILYGKRYFKKKFGVNVDIAWNVDSFGYNWQMPQFLKASGITNFVTQKIGWNDTNIFPYHLFWWEGPDGSRVLTYFPYKAYNLDIAQEDVAYDVVNYLKQFEVNTGLKNMAVLIGVGDHGGGPTEEMLDKIERLKRIPIYPKVRYSTTAEYFSYLKSLEPSSVPIWKDELYLECHRGTYTTQAVVKKENRKLEVLLSDAEKFASLAKMVAAHPYPEEALQEAWEKVLLNQFHDVLPGSSIRSVYQDAMEGYEKAKGIAKKAINSSLKCITDNINSSHLKSGKPLVVFNSLGWERKDLVSIPLGGMSDEMVIYDDRGRIIPAQLTDVEDGRGLIFIADKVPSMGYRTYQLGKRKRGTKQAFLKAGEYFLENQFFRVGVDKKTGYLSSIYDKRNGKEVLGAKKGNMLQLLEDIPKDCESWNIGLTGREWEIGKVDGIEILEKGPVRAIIRIKKSFLGEGKKKYYPEPFLRTPGTEYPSSFFIQDIMLYDGIPRIDFRMKIDWWEDRILLKVAFPVNVSSEMATYEIPGGTIQRPTTFRNSWEKARFEVPALRWADLSGHDYGVSLINDCKYGYDIHDNTMRLTLLRSPASPSAWSTPDPVADRGKHELRYCLFPHEGGWREGGTARMGYQFNYPLWVIPTTSHSGRLPSHLSLLGLAPDNLILTTLKKSEDRDDWILRFYETHGKECKARIKFPKPIDKVERVSLLEEKIEKIPSGGNEIEMPVRKNKIETIRIRL